MFSSTQLRSLLRITARSGTEMLVSSTRAYPARLSVAMLWSLMLAVVGQTEFEADPTYFGQHGLPIPRKAPGPHEEVALPGTPDVHCTSTKGDFTIEMHPEWAPIGAERFIDMVSSGALDGTVIYRVVRNEAVQFGFIKDETIRKRFNQMPNLKDDKQIFSSPNFHRGMISFAGAGPNTRGTDVFITFMTGNANGTPRAPWETPFGIIDEEGLRAVTAFNPEYGDFKSFGGNAPELGLGYEAMKKSHPNIDYLGECKLVYKVSTQFTHDNGHQFTETTTLSPEQIAWANSPWPSAPMLIVIVFVVVMVLRKIFGRRLTRLLGV